MFERIKGIFRRKEEAKTLPARELIAEVATIENLRAKMDLVLTQIDSLRTQCKAMNERVQTMERIIK